MRLRKGELLVSSALILGACFASIPLCPQLVFAQTPFYQGKTITIISGTQPGGTADMRMRATIAVLGKYIPGRPRVIAGYMPGGGGRKLANYMYRAARPNGLTIGIPASSFMALAILGAPGVQYKLNEFIFLGTPQSRAHYVFLSRKEAGLDSLEKLRGASGLRIGAQSVGHTIYIVGRLFAYGLGLKEPKFVTGYSGPELDLAVLRGEVDARVNLAYSLMRRHPEMVEKRLVDFHASLQVPLGYTHPHPRFARLPDLEDLAKTDGSRKTVAMFRRLRHLGGPLILGPGTPRERAAILQKAIDKTFDDSEFSTKFKKLTGVDPSPRSGATIEKELKQLSGDRETIELFKKLATAGRLPQH